MLFQSTRSETKPKSEKNISVLEHQRQTNIRVLLDCFSVNLTRDSDEGLGAPFMLDKSTDHLTV
jgi:hypothetical protein